MQEKNTTIIGTLDITKFSLGESKKQNSSNINNIEHRTMMQSRITLVQVTYSYTFPSETLMTHIDIQSNDQQQFSRYVEHLQVETNSLTNRTHYSQPLNCITNKNENTIVCNAVAFTYSLKLGFLLVSDIKKKNYKNQREFQQETKRLFVDLLKQINIYGFNINSNPGSVHLTKLLNISQNFKKYSLEQEAAETDILVALTLINSRRFIQASQLLKRVSKFYIQRYSVTKSMMDLNRSQRSRAKDFDEDLLGTTIKNNFTSGRALQGNKYLQKAAKIELLLAQTITHPSFLTEKLQAYYRSNCFANGNLQINNLLPDADLQDFISSISYQFIPFLLKVLSDKLEPFRIAALKAIQFILQTIGCSIGGFFTDLIYEIIITYPNNIFSEIDSAKVPYGLTNLSKGKKEVKDENLNVGLVGKNKILVDHYHHLLQTLLTFVIQVNKKISQNIFSQIISGQIINKNLGPELKLYLLRFCEKIILTTGPDLIVQMSFLGQILEICEFKKSNQFSEKQSSKVRKQKSQQTGANKQITYNLVYFGHKILSLLKTKVFNFYVGSKLQSLLQWINKTLAYLCDNELLSSNSANLNFLLDTILDLITVVYENNNHKVDLMKLHHNPIESLLYFCNMAIYESTLPFDKILQCLLTLVKYLVCIDKNCEIGREIINKILQKSKENNLVLKELKILNKIIEFVDGQSVVWLDIYLNCIPHSTFDETYEIFSILIKKSIKQLNICEEKNRFRIVKKIVKILFDQYTVKGKAYQEAKQKLVECMLSDNPILTLQFIKICLFENEEPKLENFYSKNKIKHNNYMNNVLDNQKEHKLDSKVFKIEQQLFIDKITFVQLIMSKVQPPFFIHNTHVLYIFCESLLRISQSKNFKAKYKILNIFKYLTQIMMSCTSSLYQYVILIKCLCKICKSLLSNNTYRESKLMYSVFFNMINSYKKLELPQSDIERDDKENLQAEAEKVNTIIQELFSKQSSQIQKLSEKCQNQIFYIIKIKEFIKLWNSFSGLYNSPWESVKQLFIILIIQVFKNGLSSLHQTFAKKCLQTLKPILFTFLSSCQSNQRLNGLKIFGCLLGFLKNQNDKQKMVETVCLNYKNLDIFMQKIYELQDDWNIQICQIAQSICEICLSKQNREVIKKKVAEKNFHSSIENSFCTFNLGEEFNFEKKQNSILSNSNNFDIFQKESAQFESDEINLEDTHQKIQINQEQFAKIQLFKMMINKDIESKTEKYGQKQSFIEQEQNDDQLYQIGEDKADSYEGKDNKSQEEQLQFEDLGIIELDDEEWGQEQKEVKMIQKLSLKKVNKLSPNVIGAKPQRIRSKRFQNQFNYHENIIIDELQENIQIKRQKQMINQKAFEKNSGQFENEQQYPLHLQPIEDIKGTKPMQELQNTHEQKKQFEFEKQTPNLKKIKKNSNKKRKQSNGK